MSPGTKPALSSVGLGMALSLTGGGQAVEIAAWYAPGHKSIGCRGGKARRGDVSC